MHIINRETEVKITKPKLTTARSSCPLVFVLGHRETEQLLDTAVVRLPGRRLFLNRGPHGVTICVGAGRGEPVMSACGSTSHQHPTGAQVHLHSDVSTRDSGESSTTVAPIWRTGSGWGIGSTLRVQRSREPGCSKPPSCLGEEEVEPACQVREVAAAVHHPSLIEVAEVVGVACLDHQAFQARGEVVGVHQTLQVEEEEEVVVVHQTLQMEEEEEEEEGTG
ncbi:hypothetical protein EYF80_002384 [Liparis tanakae]|uniref:Uncharacterized protein n=1 Tax=Liparis tanakae TaxID=230148 RepID=A0A4Z2JD13_9TELE|nr:hypothetical protein EYF80_002384 [Liparis tanakae]